MELDKTQRLILSNQFMILKALYPDEKEYYNAAEKIVREGYEHDYESLVEWFGDGVSESVSTFVYFVFDMFDAIQYSYNELSEEDKKQIEKRKISFHGFDGNEEPEFYSYAQFVINDLGRYKGLEIKDFNSHCNMVKIYGRILDIWKDKYNKKQELTLQELLEILKDYY